MWNKQKLVSLWNDAYDFYLVCKEKSLLLYDKIYNKFHWRPKVLNLEDSLNYIIENQCSISRYGDGEIKIATGRPLVFQKVSERMQKMMQDSLEIPVDNHVVCIPDVFGKMNYTNKAGQAHWEHHMAHNRQLWYSFLSKDRLYLDAFISRFYTSYFEKEKCRRLFNLTKRIWDKKNLLIIEGEKSRLGVGNDLFDNVNSIQRILAPNTDAFDFYDEIIEKALEFRKEDVLILLALGPTASILAWDLAKHGYWAIDIGHIDIEYELFLMGAKGMVPVKNKYVNEAEGGQDVGNIADEKYNSEIVCRFSAS